MGLTTTNITTTSFFSSSSSSSVYSPYIATTFTITTTITTFSSSPPPPHHSTLSAVLPPPPQPLLPFPTSSPPPLHHLSPPPSSPLPHLHHYHTYLSPDSRWSHLVKLKLTLGGRYIFRTRQTFLSRVDAAAAEASAGTVTGSHHTKRESISWRGWKRPHCEP